MFLLLYIAKRGWGAGEGSVWRGYGERKNGSAETRKETKGAKENAIIHYLFLLFIMQIGHVLCSCVCV